MLEQTRSHSVRAGRRAAGLALLLVAGLAGCSSNSDAAGLDLQAPTSTPSVGGAADSTPRPEPKATPSPTPSTEEQLILAQYKRFWTVQTPASQADTSTRKRLLEAVAVDPSLGRMLRGMFASDAIGEVSYGAAVVRPSIVDIKDGVAKIADCQDSSNTGRMKKATGRITTKGIPAAAVDATMLQGSDGVWRMSKVGFPETTC